MKLAISNALQSVFPEEIAAVLDDDRVIAFSLTIIASLGTFFGGILTLILVKGLGMSGAGSTSGSSGVLVGVLQAFSAGVMLYMTFMDLLPEAAAQIGARETMAYFFVGVAGFGVLETLLLDEHDHDHSFGENGHDGVRDAKPARSRSSSKHQTGEKTREWASSVGKKRGKRGDVVDLDSAHGQKQLLRTSLVTFWALLLHNLPEGLGVYLSALTDVRLGLQLAVAICLHNIPEGMAVAIPLYAAGGSSLYVLAMTFANGLAEPIGVLFGVAVLGPLLTPSVLSRSLAAVGGIMCCISVHELQPTAIRYAGQARASISLFAGMFVVFLALETVTEFFGHPHSHGGADIGHSHGGHGHGEFGHGGYAHEGYFHRSGESEAVRVGGHIVPKAVEAAFGEGDGVAKTVKYTKKGNSDHNDSPKVSAKNSQSGSSHSHESHSHDGVNYHSHH